MSNCLISVLILSIVIIVESSKEIVDDRNATTELPILKELRNRNYAKSGFRNVCRFRESLFTKVYWDWKVGAECYSYSQADWFTKRLPIKALKLEVENVNYTIPYGLTEEGKQFGFNYSDPVASEIIANSFASDLYFRKWENCAKNGDDCCRKEMDEINIFPSEDYPCPATWDAWSCFLPAKRDSISELPCPDYTSSSSDTPCILYSQKQCFPNGTWNQQTDYATCATAPVYRKRHNFHITVLYVSIALSFPAVVIFLSYRNLRILRVNLHRNLLIACIIRNIFTILSKELVIMDSLKPSKESNNVLGENGVWCRILAYFNSVAANAIYACMLMDGFYLHKLIVRIFSSDPNVYIMHGVTAVLSILPTTIWAIFVATQADDHCWMVDGSWYQWIPDGFRIAILSINIILLIDIIRALLCKLRQNVSAQHTKSTLKAMAFLIPLFGVPFILTANRNIINNDSCRAGDIFYYVSYSIQALQGVMVAVLFCYWNKEVHTQLKSTYRKLNLLYQARFAPKNDHRQETYRRETAATYVNNNSAAPRRNSFGNNLPQPTRDSTTKVKDWLTGNQVGGENLASVPLTSFKHDPEQLKNGSPDRSRRISKFIDDSTESLRKISESAPVEDVKMEELTKSFPNIPSVTNQDQ